MEGNIGSFRNIFITSFIQNLIFLEPLNLFLYTWRFLRELEQSATSKIVKKLYKWLEFTTIALIPLAFYTTVLVW